MLRLVSAVLAFFALGIAGAAAEGTTYNDPNGRFSLTVPTGWTAQKPDGEGIAVFLTSPTDQEIGGACFVMVRDLPQTRKMKQADLDEAFGAALTEDFWKKAFAAAGVKDVQIEDSGQKDQNGRKIYFVVATIAGTTKDGVVAKATAKQVLHVVPGSLQFVQCMTMQAMYQTMTPQFEAVFASFDPKGDQLVAQAPQAGPSVLTLFEGGKFDGVARVIAQDTANVPALGLNGVTASIAIAGYGQWEVCEGVNFAGNCRLVAAAASADAGREIRIGSVRRYFAPNDPMAALGVASATSGVALKSALEPRPR